MHKPAYGPPWTIPNTIHTYLISKFNNLIFSLNMYLLFLQLFHSFLNNYFTPFPYPPTWIWKGKLTSIISTCGCCCTILTTCIFLCLNLKGNNWKIQLVFEQVVSSSTCIRFSKTHQIKEYIFFPFSHFLTKTSKNILCNFLGKEIISSWRNYHLFTLKSACILIN